MRAAPPIHTTNARALIPADWVSDKLRDIDPTKIDTFLHCCTDTRNAKACCLVDRIVATKKGIGGINSGLRTLGCIPSRASNARARGRRGFLVMTKQPDTYSYNVPSRLNRDVCGLRVRAAANRGCVRLGIALAKWRADRDGARLGELRALLTSLRAVSTLRVGISYGCCCV